MKTFLLYLMLIIALKSQTGLAAVDFGLRPVGVIADRFVLEVTGPANRVYRVERSSDLINWNLLWTTNVPSEMFLVSDATGSGNSFYRAKADPKLYWPGDGLFPLQGLHGNTLVAGKTTAFRLFTDSLTYSRASRIEATILRADGSRLVAAWPRANVVSIPSSSLGASLAVLVPGSSLPWVGGYYVTASVLDASGALLAKYTFDKFDLLPTKDLLIGIDRLWAGSINPGTPQEIQAARDGIERLASVWPVRDGISALDGDRTAGVRYVINNNPEGPPNQDGQLCPFFASLLGRPAGFDSINVGVAYRFQDPGEDCGGSAPHFCSGQTLPWAFPVCNGPLGAIFGQEMGHCWGLEPPEDPHYDPTVQAGHSRDATIAFEDAELGFDIQLNRPFPQPTYDNMHQVICGCPDFATAYNTWDWEYLRQRFAQLSSTGPTGPFIAFDDLYGSGLQLVPAVATNADGRQEVFIIGGDRQLYHTWELTPGGNWSSWSPLYGASLQNPVAAAINQDGRLEVYVRGGDNAVYFRSQSSPNGGWNNWLGLGGTDVRDFAVNRNADGRLEMVSVWGDGTLRDAWQTSPGGAWSGWVSLGGTSLSPAVALGRNEDGRLESFVVGGDGIVYHRWQTVPSSGPWSDWRNLADPSLPAITDITVNNGPDGRLYVFMMRSDGAISYRAQGAPNSGFAGPVHLYGSGLRFPCAVGMNPDGRLETFVIGGDRRLYNTWQIDPARPDLWSSWASIGGVSLQAGVALGSAPNGELQVFVLGGNGQLYRGRR